MIHNRNTSGLRFYQVFKFGGTTGVNSLSLGEVIGANFVAIIVNIFIVALIATFLPFITLLIYFIYAWAGYNNPDVDLTRIRLNLFGIISYIYFLADYHFGFFGTIAVHIFCGREALDYLCFLNTALMLINVVLLFYGNRLFNSLDHAFVRVVYFLVIVFALFKMFTPVSSRLMPKMITQFDYEAYQAEEERKIQEEERLEEQKAELNDEGYEEEY